MTPNQLVFPRAAILAACLFLSLPLTARAQSTLPALAKPLESPRYPAEAMRYGIEGTTVVAVHVLETGTAGDVLIARTSGFNLLDAEAIRLARSAQFVPAQRGGAPADAWVRLPIAFVIQGARPRAQAVDAITLNAPLVSDSEILTVSLTRDGLLYLGSEPVGLEDLRDRLKAAAKAGRVSLELRADQDALYGRVAGVIALAQQTGIASIRFMVAPP